MSSSLSIGLIGYGKMGKAIESAATTRGISIGEIISSQNNEHGEGIRRINKNDVDVLLDFSVPHAVVTNIIAAAECGINIVVGTTGWYNDIQKVKSVVDEKGIGMFYASNFSIGMNILFQLVKNAVRYVNDFPEYDIFVHEIHHTQKKDSPSGSALTLAEQIIQTSARKKRIETGRIDGLIDPETLHVSSLRAGSVIGTHHVGFDSEFDSIELKHAAKNRNGFVMGALRAAEWLRGKSGVYTMDDLINI